MSHKDVWTGVAWLSSVRGLSCSLKWGNERNLRLVLQVSRGTAPLCGEEAEMTPSQHDPLISWATRMIQWPPQWAAMGQPGANPKKRSQFGLRAAIRPHEVGIASNRGSSRRGEYVLESCTHRPSLQGSREYLKFHFGGIKVGSVTWKKS